MTRAQKVRGSHEIDRSLSLCATSRLCFSTPALVWNTHMAPGACERCACLQVCGCVHVDIKVHT
jgi:hypothetical protein